MGTFFAYILKSGLCLAAYYLCYKLLLCRETFHRFNRVAIVGLLLASFVLPLIQLAPMETGGAGIAEINPDEFLSLAFVVENDIVDTSTYSTHYWIALAILIYLGGIVVFGLRSLFSYLSLAHILRRGRRQSLMGGRILILHHDHIAPFSWLRYIVVNEQDYNENARAIMLHELGHIRHRHTIDLLLTEVALLLQWFNPAIWLMRRELQIVHEYEADEEVLNQGLDAQSYQMLLIKKAAGSRLQSITNCLHQSSIKKRITMMLKKKSNPWACAKCLFALPVAAISVAVFATPEATAFAADISDCKVSTFFANEQMSEPVFSPFATAESNLDLPEDQNDNKIILKDGNFQIVPTTGKGTDEQPSSQTANQASQSVQKDHIWANPEQMPEFPGGEQALMKYIKETLKYPASCVKDSIEGRVTLSFDIMDDGSVSNVSEMRSPHPDLTAEAKRVVEGMPLWKPGMQMGKAVKTKYVLPITFRLSSDTKAPAKATAHETSSEVFTAVEQLPEFPGGEQALMQFLKETIKYPTTCFKDSIEGRVILSFVVKADGSVGNISEMNSPHPDLTAEAIRVIKAMPHWKPGMQKGVAVNVMYVLPINFRLSTGNKPNKESVQNAADSSKKSIRIGTKQELTKLLVFVDDKPVSTDYLNDMDNSNIDNIHIIKDEAQMAQYTDRPGDYEAIILISTKK